MVVASARPRVAWSGGAPYSRRRPNRAATPGGDAGDVPAMDWMGKERGKGVLGMENPDRGGFEEVREVKIALRDEGDTEAASWMCRGVTRSSVRPRESSCGRVACEGRHERDARRHRVGATQLEHGCIGLAWPGSA
uniref:Uncharacterized protein n=1 Tax=Oryza rufipogon TaxID=4529 RepID=A0A0E0QB48_ORYRU